MEEDNQDNNDNEGNLEVIEYDDLNVDMEDEYYEAEEGYGSSDGEQSEEEVEAVGMATDAGYDKTLPSRHKYLGKTKELSGRFFGDEDESLKVPLLLHASLMNLVLVPGQTLPLTVFNPQDVSMLKSVIQKDRIFGIVHARASDRQASVMAPCGTTAEIYEYHEDEVTGKLSLKAKGRQRFKLLTTRREITGVVVATVKILPESNISDPFKCVRLQSFDNIKSCCGISGPPSVLSPRKVEMVQKSTALLTQWPLWIYDQYQDYILADKVIKKITSNTLINIKPSTMPADPFELAQWATINLPIGDNNRLALLSLNSLTQRLRYILSVLDNCQSLQCKNCSVDIAKVSDIFSMSVEGPQGTFVNPGGYVHEMMTLGKAHGLSYHGFPSTEYSWFPGYAWTIANCASCYSHLGWKFTASKKKMQPQKFYGLVRKSLKSLTAIASYKNDPNHICII